MAITGIADPISGTTITTSFAVINLTDPIREHIALLGSGVPPGAAGKVNVSTDATHAGWTAPADSTLMTTSKVNKAGDTMSGNLTAPNLIATNTLSTGGSGTIGNALSIVGILSAASAAIAGAFSAASAGLTGAVTAASATLTGLLTAANVTATNALAAGGSITAGNAISAVGALSGASAALTGGLSAASGAITGVLNAGTLQQGGTAVAALFAAIGHTHTAMAKVNTGSYAGNSGTRVITGLGFAPKTVFIINSTTGNTAGFLQNGVSIAMTGSGGIGSGTGTMDADGFTLSGASGVNASGNNYAYVAYG